MGVRYGSSSPRQQGSFGAEVSPAGFSHEGREFCGADAWRHPVVAVPCFHPIDAWYSGVGVVFAQPGDGKPVPADLQVPCGRCIGCRLRRSAEWADRCMHEASLSGSNCFLTLTYDDAHLPADGSLRHVDFQKFVRRARQRCGPFRFYMCGEYGPELARPHYHACLFGLDFVDRVVWKKSDSGELCYTSEVLSGLWKLGRATVQDLTLQSAAYCARYVVDKITGDLAKAHYGGLRPEYNRMSLRPGVGARWFERFSGDLRNDYVVRNGREAQVPRYYDKLRKRRDAIELAEAKEVRAEKARLEWRDNTPERLAVKEEVQLARVGNLKRGSR